MATGEAGSDTASAIGKALDELGLPFEHPEPGAYLVKLQGTHKLATMTWLIAGQHSLQVEAFFCRQPDENHAEFYRFLLTRSARMYGVHFALDKLGAVYLTGCRGRRWESTSGTGCSAACSPMATRRSTRR